jgi:23S rRNA pseudoU1915 N3-methylase RlmH
MKTLLIAIGKTDNKYLTSALDDYLGRANHYAPIEMKVIPDIRDVKNLSQEQQKERPQRSRANPYKQNQTKYPYHSDRQQGKAYLRISAQALTL